MTWAPYRNRRSLAARAARPEGTANEWFVPPDFYRYCKSAISGFRRLPATEVNDLVNAVRSRLLWAADHGSLDATNRTIFAAWLTMLDEFEQWRTRNDRTERIPVGLYALIYVYEDTAARSRRQGLWLAPMLIACGRYPADDAYQDAPFRNETAND